METEYARRLNSIPVVFLSFKHCLGETMDAIKDDIAAEIFKEYKKHSKYLVTEADREGYSYFQFFKTLKALKEKKIDETHLKYSIYYLLEALYAFHGVRPIVLLDEYDSPVIKAHLGGFSREFTQFFYSGFLIESFKGNPHLGQALITGITKVSTNLDNIVTYTVDCQQFSPYFGFNKEEARSLLAYYNLELSKKVSAFYNGYLFSDIHIYNPWSILNYAATKILQNYRVKTSIDKLIKDSVIDAKYDFHYGLKKLIRDDKVSVMLNFETSFADLPRANYLWGLLVNAGYLTVVKADYKWNRFICHLPNEESRKEFEEVVLANTKLD